MTELNSESYRTFETITTDLNALQKKHGDAWGDRILGLGRTVVGPAGRAIGVFVCADSPAEGIDELSIKFVEDSVMNPYVSSTYIKSGREIIVGRNQDVSPGIFALAHHLGGLTLQRTLTSAWPESKRINERPSTEEINFINDFVRNPDNRGARFDLIQNSQTNIIETHYQLVPDMHL